MVNSVYKNLNHLQKPTVGGELHTICFRIGGGTAEDEILGGTTCDLGQSSGGPFIGNG